MQVEKLIADLRNPRVNRSEQREELDLLAQLNRSHLAQRNGDLELEGQIRAMETAFHIDLAHRHTDPAVKQDADDFVQLMTPIVKQYCEEIGVSYEQTGLIESYRQALRYLHEVGAPLRASHE